MSRRIGADGLPDQRSRKEIAQGCPYRHGYRLVIDTDVDTRNQIVALARKNNTSMSAMVRLLIEWGLEAVDED